nr:hypothetical protein [uncultured Ottowia sp.]
MRYGQQVSAVAGLEFALKKSGMCSLQGAFSCAALFSGGPARQTVQPGEGFSCLFKKTVQRLAVLAKSFARI